MAGVVHNRRRVRDSVVDDIVHLGLIHERTRERKKKEQWGIGRRRKEREPICAPQAIRPTLFSVLLFPLLAIYQ